MLLATITGLDDQRVAERMREICAHLGADEAVTLQAIDVALARFQARESLKDSLNAGLRFVLHVKASARYQRTSMPAPKQMPDLVGLSNFTRTDWAALAVRVIGGVGLAVAIATAALS